jgi:hypothetical protein
LPSKHWIYSWWVYQPEASFRSSASDLITNGYIETLTLSNIMIATYRRRKNLFRLSVPI